jgi:hypothetical protein
MEVLKNMYDKMDGDFMLGFTENRLHAAIHTNKDAMEPSVFSSIQLSEIQSEVNNEISAITDIVDGLNLYRNIFHNESEG